MTFSPNPAPRPLIVDVALVPTFLPSAATNRAGTVFVVVDVIRATTTLCVLFERGCRRVLVASGIEAARRAREACGVDHLLAGESGGLAPSGFDFGNSPRELAAASIAGRNIVFATTNGTRALRACQGGRAVYAGAFRNADAVMARTLAVASRSIAASTTSPASRTSETGVTPETSGSGASEAELGQAQPDVVIVCSGRGNLPAYDDTICAGYLVERLLAHAGSVASAVELREGARIARSCAAAALASNTVHDALAVSDAAHAVESIGLLEDLAWCAGVDASPVVPAVTTTEGPEGLIVMEAVGMASA